jgi:MFS family permease
MKNKKAIILLFIANTITGFAQGITIIAIPWYITSSSGLGLQNEWIKVFLGITICILGWILYAGTLIDKYNRKKIFLINSIVECIMLLSIALIGFYLGHLPAYLAIIAFAGIFFSFVVHYPNLYAFAQEITEPKYYHKITSWIEIQGQTTSA